MEVCFELTTEDFNHLKRWQQRASSMEIKAVALLLFAWLITQQFQGDESSLPTWQQWWTLPQKSGFLLGQFFTYLSLLIPASVFLCFWLFVFRPLLWACYRIVFKPVMQDVSRVILNADYLYLGESVYAWPQLSKWEQDNTHILGRLTDGKHFVIPKRAFADAESSQHFFDAGINYWQQNRAKLPPIPIP